MKIAISAREIEAVLFDGELIGEPDPANEGQVLPGTCPAWFSSVIREGTPGDFGWERGSMVTNNGLLYISTGWGTETIYPGDWLVLDHGSICRATIQPQATMLAGAFLCEAGELERPMVAQ